MDKKNILIISIVLVVVVVFSIIVYRKKKKDSLEKIIDAVDTDYKVLDDSITDELKHVKVDLTYNAENDYNIIKNADGGLWNDNEEAVYSTLSNKKASQIKAIDLLFLNKQGQSLEKFLKGFLNDSEMEKAITIIRNAKNG